MNNDSKKNMLALDDLLNLFGDDITVSDIIASKLLGKVSASIVKKRMELNMTQKEFAAYMDVSQGMVSRWEGGDYNFSIKTLADVAEKLNMDLNVSLSSGYGDMQVQHIHGTDVSYVVSGQKEFIGKPCKVISYKSATKITKDINDCRFYSFCERIEM